MGFLRRILYGRYGTDQLSLFLAAVYVLLYLLSSLLRLAFLSLIALFPLGIVLFRMFSRNIERRRAENRFFLGMFAPVTRWYRTRRSIRRDRDHCYFKCPGCSQHLRVPKGKGKIQVTCRACGAQFESKS